MAGIFPTVPSIRCSAHALLSGLLAVAATPDAGLSAQSLLFRNVHVAGGVVGIGDLDGDRHDDYIAGAQAHAKGPNGSIIAFSAGPESSCIDTRKPPPEPRSGLPSAEFPTWTGTTSMISSSVLLPPTP